MIKHPWLEKYPIKSKSKYLIIGTHPPMPYCGKLEYYYGNMSEFWKFLNEVYPGNKLYSNGCPDIKDILNFLDKSKISITDIVYKTNVLEISTDNDMGKLKFDDLNPYLSDWLKASKIDTIYFTSFGGSNSAKNLFKKWYKNTFGKVCKINNGHINTLNIHGLKISIIDLFSPSPTARRSSSRIKEFKIWQQSNEKNIKFDDFRVYWYKKYLPKI
jgi:hypothetical protein